MKSKAELHQELRQRILNLSGVTERQNAGIHEDAFFVGRKMFMHIHGHGHCDIRLSKGDQERALTEGKARPHRWAPEAGYVTLIVDDEEDLEPAMASLPRVCPGKFPSFRSQPRNACWASPAQQEPSGPDAARSSWWALEP